MALTEKLTAIADAIRVQSGKTDKLTLTQMPQEILDLQSLNFEVVGNPQPFSPKENTIWVDTDTQINGWFAASEDPTTIHCDTDLMDGLTYAEGYIGSDGAIYPQIQGNPELYTVEYVPVKHGAAYRFAYRVSAANLLWFSVNEYAADYSFIQQITFVGADYMRTESIGTYTPSSANVKFVRLSWRTFPGATWDVSFVEPADGVVWIQTGTASSASFNALKKNGIQVYPISAKQYIGGTWVDMTAKIYQNGTWVDWINTIMLYDNGGRYVEFEVSNDGGENAFQTANTLSLSAQGVGYGYWVSKDKVNIGAVTKLCADVARESGPISALWIGLVTSKESASPVASIDFTADSAVDGVCSTNLTNVQAGEYYIKAYMAVAKSNTARLHIRKLYCE